MISIDVIRDPDLSSQMIATLVARLDDYLYPLNDFTSYHLATKNNSYLKTFSQEHPTSECSVDFYKLMISALASHQIEAARSWQQNTAAEFDYFYIGSRNSLRSKFFYDYFPSAFDCIYSYFVNNAYVKQIGSGLGSAFLFNTSKFKSFEFTLENRPNYISSIENISSIITGLQADNNFLLEVLEVQKFEINSLREEINSLNKKIYDQTQMTWR